LQGRGAGIPQPADRRGDGIQSVFVVTYCLGRRRFKPAVGLADIYLACLVTGLGEERGSLSCGGIDRGSEAGHSPRQIDQGWVSP
jgi:hypothetical protein